MTTFNLQLLQEALNHHHLPVWHEQLHAMRNEVDNHPKILIQVFHELLCRPQLKKRFFEDFLNPLSIQQLQRRITPSWSLPFFSLLHGALEKRNRVAVDLIVPRLNTISEYEWGNIGFTNKPSFWFKHVWDLAQTEAKNSNQASCLFFYHASRKDDFHLAKIFLEKTQLSSIQFLVSPDVVQLGNAEFRLYRKIWEEAYQNDPNFLEYFHQNNQDPLHEWVLKSIRSYKEIAERQWEVLKNLPGFEACLKWKNSDGQDALAVALYRDHTTIARKLEALGLSLPPSFKGQSIEEYRQQYMPETLSRRKTMGLTAIDWTDEEIKSAFEKNELHQETLKVTRRSTMLRL